MFPKWYFKLFYLIIKHFRYVEKHKEVCELEDCYLKEKINKKKKMSIEEEMNDICK